MKVAARGNRILKFNEALAEIDELVVTTGDSSTRRASIRQSSLHGPLKSWCGGLKKRFQGYLQRE